MSRIEHHLPAYLDLKGQFRRAYHLEMIADRERVGSIITSLDDVLCPEDVFLEAGTGTGIFAIQAAKRCRRVYAIEVDPEIAAIAEYNIRRSGVAERIKLVVGDVLEIEVPERVDVALCEMMSIWAVEEPVVKVANHLHTSVLRRGGRFVPEKIVNLAELASYRFDYEGATMRAVIPLFGGVSRPTLMTGREVCRVLDLGAPLEDDLSVDVEFQAVAEGTVNCVVLSSIVQFSSNSVFSGSDSLMPPTVVPLQEDVQVRFGSPVRLRGLARSRGILGPACFRAEVLAP